MSSSDDDEGYFTAGEPESDDAVRSVARRRDALRRAQAPKPKLRFRCTRCAADVVLKPAQVAALARRGVAGPTLCFACFGDRRPRPTTTDLNCAVCPSSTQMNTCTYERVRKMVPAHLPLICQSCHRRMRGRGHGWFVAAATCIQCAFRRHRAAKAARGLRALRLSMQPPQPTPAPMPAFSPSPAFFELLVEQRVAAALAQQQAWQQQQQQQQLQWHWEQSRERVAFERASMIEQQRSHGRYVDEYPSITRSL